MDPKVPFIELKDIEKGDKIGAGQFGEVYKGKYITSTVALKFYK